MFDFYVTQQIIRDNYILMPYEDEYLDRAIVSPMNYFKPVVFMVLGINLSDATLRDMDEFSLEKMIDEDEKGVPLMMIQGNVFIQRELYRAGYSPTNYVAQIAPQLAELPEFLLIPESAEASIDPEDIPNIFLFNHLSFFGHEGVSEFPTIFNRLPLMFLQHYNLNVDAFVFQAPPIPLALTSEEVLELPSAIESLGQLAEKLEAMEEQTQDKVIDMTTTFQALAKEDKDDDGAKDEVEDDEVAQVEAEDAKQADQAGQAKRADQAAQAEQAKEAAEDEETSATEKTVPTMSIQDLLEALQGDDEDAKQKAIQNIRSQPRSKAYLDEHEEDFTEAANLTMLLSLLQLDAYRGKTFDTLYTFMDLFNDDF